MIASRVVVVSEVVAELAFRMKLPGIHDVDVSALYPSVTCVTWPPAPFKSCYLARNLKEVARA